MLSIATLICVYAEDDPDLLRLALHSIREQRLPPGVTSRIYLGIDGPVGGELEQVLREFHGAVYLVYRSAANCGLAATLNELILRLGDESFLFRMDSDDISLPGRYIAQLDHMASHPDIDIIGTAITEVDASNGTQRIVTFATGPDDAVRNIHKRVPIAHPTACFRRHVFETISGYPLQGTNEDIALWFACIRQGFRFDNIRDSYLNFRLGPDFWRRRGARKAWSEFRCYVNGIYDMHGAMTLRYLYPFARLLVRLAPSPVARRLYSSRLRKVFVVRAR